MRQRPLWFSARLCLGIEIAEFGGLVARGAGPSRSAFLPAFFTQVGTHGLYVTAGMMWLLVMLVQVATRGFRPSTMRRLRCFALFWHALDHRLGGAVQRGLPDGNELMDERSASAHDAAPRVDGSEAFVGLTKYLIGLGLAVVLIIASFWAAGTGLIYGPAVPIALAALAIAQMSVHLVFFLRITTAPDNTNDILALAFGILIVTLVVAGSLWIVASRSQHDADQSADSNAKIADVGAAHWLTPSRCARPAGTAPVPRCSTDAPQRLRQSSAHRAKAAQASLRTPPNGG